MTPILWVGAAGVLSTALGFGAGTYVGMGLGEDKEFAKRAREDSIVQETREAAQQGAAAAIALIKPRNVTIRQETEREIQTNTVYRDCRVPAGGMRLANEAITGRTEPTGDGELPNTDAAK